MQGVNLNSVNRKLRSNKNRKTWKKVVTVLMAIVVFCTTYALILPAITLTKTYCGKEEHQHTEECYQDRLLFCHPDNEADIVIHQHDDSCYKDGVLICELEETELHTHDASCYDENGTLICGKEEIQLHVHDDSCFDQEGNLVCDKKQVIQHQHTDECFTAKTTLDTTCTQDADAIIHHHTRLCYDYKGNLICHLDEISAHQHTEACYNADGTLICTLEELKLHTHDESCYQDGVLICGQAQVIEHQHTLDCISEKKEQPTDSDKTKQLVCGKEEHTHTEECGQEPEAYSFTYTNDDSLITVTLDYDEQLPEDLECNIIVINEENDQYQSMIDSIYQNVGNIKESTLYQLEWISNGETYTLPEGIQPTIKVEENTIEEDSELIGVILQEEHNYGGTGTVASPLIKSLQVNIFKEETSDDEDETKYSSTTVESDDGTTLQTKLSSNAATFAVVRLASASSSSGYYVRVNKLGADETDAAGNTTYGLYEAGETSTSGHYYMIVSANGSYRLADTSGGGAGLQMNPIAGHEDCYTLQCTTCGNYMLPTGYSEVNGSTLYVSVHTASNWTMSMNSYYGTYTIKRSKDSSTLYLGTSGGWYGNGNQTSSMELSYQSDAKVWWIQGTNGYYLRNTGTPQSGSISGDGTTCNPKGDTYTKGYGKFTLTSNAEADGDCNMLIFRWVEGELEESSDESKAASLDGPTQQDETSYTYTDIKSSVIETDKDISGAVSGATAQEITSKTDETDISKTLGNIITTKGNETALAEQQSNDGRLITSKSIVYHDDNYDVWSEDEYNDDEFSVTLSALAQEWGSGNEQTLGVPIDAIFVLDTSSDMEKTGTQGTAYWIAAASSINKAMRSILDQNTESRVGLVTYSNTAKQTLQLGRHQSVTGTSASDGYLRYTESANQYSSLKTYDGTSIDSEWDRNNMQLGLETAYKMFKAQDVEYNKRQPVIILVSAGMPTMGTFSYMTPSKGPYYGNGTSKGVFGFYSVLSAQYFKKMTGVHYGTRAMFYSIGIGVSDSTNEGKYATAVLNPNDDTIGALKNLTGTNSYNRTYGGSTDDVWGAFYHLCLSDREGTGGSGGTYMVDTGSDEISGIGTTANKLRGVYNEYSNASSEYYKSYYYCDQLLTPSNATEIGDAFDTLVKQLHLTNNYDFKTKDNSNITITDTLGDNITIQSDGDTDAIRLLWYKTESDTSRTSTTNKVPIALKYNSKTTNSDGSVTYSWSKYQAFRTGAAENTSDSTKWTGGPDSKQYGQVQDIAKSLTADQAITATVTTTVTADPADSSHKITKQAITWSIPVDLLPSLYPDLYDSFYYEEQPVRLIYRVGLSDSEVEWLELQSEEITKEYTIHSVGTDSNIVPATATFTTIDGNPYYTTSTTTGSETTWSSKSGTLNNTVTNGVGYTESISNYQVTQSLYAEGTLKLTREPVISITQVNKKWNDDGKQERSTSVTAQLYQESTLYLIGYEYENANTKEITKDITPPETWISREGESNITLYSKENSYDITGKGDTWSTKSSKWNSLPLEGDNNTRDSNTFYVDGVEYTPIYKTVYSYYLAEKEIPNGYRVSYQLNNKNLKNITLYTTDNINYTTVQPEDTGNVVSVLAAKITNVGEVNIINTGEVVTITIQWQDNNVDHSNDSVTVYLYRCLTNTSEWSLLETITLNDSNDWSVSRVLPKKYNGSDCTYYLLEKPIDKYAAVYTIDEESNEIDASTFEKDVGEKLYLDNSRYEPQWLSVSSDSYSQAYLYEIKEYKYSGTNNYSADVVIINSNAFELPSTGGIGPDLFTVCGEGIIGLTLILYMCKIFYEKRIHKGGDG